MIHQENELTLLVLLCASSLTFWYAKYSSIFFGWVIGLWMCKTVAEQLWVLDSVPGKLIPRNDEGEVEKVLQILQSLPPEIPSRKYFLCLLCISLFRKFTFAALGSFCMSGRSWRIGVAFELCMFLTFNPVTHGHASYM